MQGTEWTRLAALIVAQEQLRVPVSSARASWGVPTLLGGCSREVDAGRRQDFPGWAHAPGREASVTGHLANDGMPWLCLVEVAKGEHVQQQGPGSASQSQASVHTSGRTLRGARSLTPSSTCVGSASDLLSASFCRCRPHRHVLALLPEPQPQLTTAPGFGGAPGRASGLSRLPLAVEGAAPRGLGMPCGSSQTPVLHSFLLNVEGC